MATSHDVQSMTPWKEASRLKVDSLNDLQVANFARVCGQSLRYGGSGAFARFVVADVIARKQEEAAVSPTGARRLRLLGARSRAVVELQAPAQRVR